MLNEHELRRTVVEEMHLRRWPALHAPCLIVQMLKVVDRAADGDRDDALASLPQGTELDPNPNPRHRSGRIGANVHFGWERQSEANTVTLFFEGEDSDALPTPDPAGGDAQRAMVWALEVPGAVLRATRVIVKEDDAAIDRVRERIRFDPDELVSCQIGAPASGPRARIWSDFKLREDGFGLVLVAANGMLPGDLSRTVQRLQELGNYRNLALLGLPVARHGWSVLDAIERELNAITGRVAEADVTDDRLLEEVTRLSIELATAATAADFRMSATEAYGKIVEERLADLHIVPCEGMQSLTDFTQRRLLPAVRTCRSHQRRSEQLAQRTAQFISLFRTRIETRIENQNARLLASMERNAVRQLRLQQLVEGFSVVAMTYYAVGLIAHVLEGLHDTGFAIDVGLSIAIITPVVALAIWFTIRRLRDHLLK